MFYVNVDAFIGEMQEEIHNLQVRVKELREEIDHYQLEYGKNY